jgi:hypothetical protein
MIEKFMKFNRKIIKFQENDKIILTQKSYYKNLDFINIKKIIIIINFRKKIYLILIFKN